MFSVPRAAPRTASSVAPAVAASRAARTVRVRSTWRLSETGSSRCSSIRSPPVSSTKAFTPTILPRACLDRDRPLVGRRLDLALHPASLDRRDRPAALVHLADELERPLLELAGERLDVVGAAERICRRGDARLVRDHLLRAQRDRRGVLRRESERLVEAVRVQRLAAAEHRRERLDRDPRHVHLRLLRRERRAARLSVKPERERPGVRHPEPPRHDPGPQPPRRPELGDLLQEVVVSVEEERQPRTEHVRVEARRRPPPGSRRSRSQA